ncbi:hypothetical protein A3A14_00710 [Candidatus Daviesbacteria bacterium RIFCSPLOWO2_01_FULL_43_38]|uniref:Uncharacterized protein n=1 Tax=Candidatus Daviesbacteria bacterium RIFCSPHIGHO2_12_FULL_43_11 TaxID=1797780 RepID=A0A1F5K2G4_9BACT|nr:MAG: hypothetical protein A2874_01430 [Candidatus Daviesbacteria bacterium RIFCSPHIGHO2_01_FULL_43_17]OGE35122.1 MAG: hypothetical protein A3E45_03265 [Candidatus Daviesbacteria bacterium RIFCSPHIGHO2_12_FULL_43_11]OGE63260.1 MAG: hypothetical protein A3A14_00710 [Candidatus Daviesbacteria bacterium RIFCSPLOWO2_01_FULL_43_38]OGE70652.1 MAG: hypothetical protein A3J21_02635 [Candidatus Daviesbacteria bacterium RIFCSPLOWO2_02_FULL_43_11]
MDPQAFQSYPTEKKLFSRKNIIALLAVGILFLSVPFAVKLVQEQQELRSKASGGDVINFTGPGVECKGNECTTTEATINIELRAPAPTTAP